MSQPTYEGILHNVEFPEQLLTLDPQSSKVVGDLAINGPESRYQTWLIEAVRDGELRADADDETFCTLWNVGGKVYITITTHSSVIATSSEPYNFFAIEYGNNIGFQVYDGPTLDLGSRDPGTQVKLVVNSSKLKSQQLWTRTSSLSRP